jgi:hypothetical protein
MTTVCSLKCLGEHNFSHHGDLINVSSFMILKLAVQSILPTRFPYKVNAMTFDLKKNI